MTTPNSATGGYLVPTSPPPFEDEDLDGQLQAAIAGITALDGILVRPKWQGPTIADPKRRPPPQPPVTTNWCAFGRAVVSSDVNASLIHDGDADSGLGTSTLYRGEEIEVDVTFYGPNCRSFASMLRDGLGLVQNRETLRSEGMAFVKTERITYLPEFGNMQWIPRADLIFLVRRFVGRTYAIENVVEIQGTVIADADGVVGETELTSPIDVTGF